jgi:hypothetical protein
MSLRPQSTAGRRLAWLVGSGLGLVPIARASHFQWPGTRIPRSARPWIALLDGHRQADGGEIAVLMFGTRCFR